MELAEVKAVKNISYTENGRRFIQKEIKTLVPLKFTLAR